MNAAAPQPKENMGAPAPRYDARLKVTGAARYPADVPMTNPAFAFLVTSSIAKGKLVALEVEDATKVSPQHRELPNKGNAEAALATADVVIDAEYGTPTQHHNPLELFSTTCVWEGDKLTVYEPSQFVYGLKNGVAQRLGIDA